MTRPTDSAARARAAVSPEAAQRLEDWPPKQRRVFLELVEDAPTELQREMLQRALLAGRTPAEIHAFADEVRAMPDADLYEACTLSERSGLEDSVVAQLRAEADPIYAFTANGNALEPTDDEISGASRVRHVPAALLVPPEVPKVLPSRKVTFEGMSALGRAPKRDTLDLGASAEDPPTMSSAEGRHAEDLLNAATKAWELRYRERPIDDPAEVLELARAALRGGVPVPVVLGSAPRHFSRYALMLQAQPAGASWAFQLHDPLAGETVWANQGDLVNGVELPFSNKRLRRITAIALPTG